MRLLIITFGVISFLLFACKKEPGLTSSRVKIKNEYFESLDSIKLAAFKVNKLEIGGLSEAYVLDEGRYDFSCVTKSNLAIKVSIKIVGSERGVIIAIKNNGLVQLE